MRHQNVNLSAELQRCKIRNYLVSIIAACLLLILGPSAVYALSEENYGQNSDRAIVQGLKAIKQNRWDEGRALISGARDPFASKLFFWLYFQKGKADDTDYTTLVQFIRKNPDWPGMKKLLLQAENKMPDVLSLSESMTWFHDYPPMTSRGLGIYLDALILTGKEQEVRNILFDWWTSNTVSRDAQKDIYSKYGRFLTREAHRKRFDMLLFEGHYTSARAMANLLGEGYLELAEARIAIAEQKPDINALIAEVPRNLLNDPGLLYERLKYRRENDLDEEAIQILRRQPDLKMISNPDDWWKERHIIIRRLIEENQFKKAYQLAAAHGQLEGLSFAQAEWIAGWLSLRFLRDPLTAYKHFEHLYKGVDSPISLSRAAYWAGRAAESLRQPEPATEWYALAAKYQTTFYGQTAGAELGKQQALDYAAPPQLTPVDKQEFNRSDLIRAARAFSEAGMRSEASQFLQAFVKSKPDAKHYFFAAETASKFKDYTDVIKIAKEATKEGLFLTAQSFPIIPDQMKNVPIDWALVHAIIRQESQFDLEARSPVGAMGLMQLMPGTASDTAKKLGVASQPGLLTTSASYNIMLGSEYLRQMLVRFGGSYPMAIAAYNAGPGRVDKWIKTYGDPRVGEVDMIDWIELIPIYETRNYVHRVMEGVYVYNLRLRNIADNLQDPIHVARSYRRN